MALPGIIVAMLFFYVRDYETIALTRPAGSGDEKTDAKMRWREIAGHLLKNKTLIFNNLAFAANTFVTTAMLTWLPSYFQRVEGISMSSACDQRVE